MKAELVPENGDPPIPITRDLVVIGRRGYCDIVIDHPSLSKRHAVLVKTDGLLVIRDLISTNGTKVKGQRIRWAALLPDDRIALGNYKLRVYLGADQLPGPSELYQAKAVRGGLSARTAAGASTSKTNGPTIRTAPAVAPAPAPSSSEHDFSMLPREKAKDSDPLLPIVLDDDDDEIIDLD